MTDWPLVVRVRQRFATSRIDDVPGEVLRQLQKLNLGAKVSPGQTVALTAGSRGIANIAPILRTIAAYLRTLGAKPFVVPAMGSHGGGTAEGQLAMLSGLGITQETVGCPICSSMETVLVCTTSGGVPVHIDRHAFEADHVLVCNRIKPHTHFTGDVESGLMKMLLIGLGKRTGAEIYHRAIVDFSFGEIVRSVAEEVIRRCRVLAGVALVENAFDETALVEAVAPEAFEIREKELLLLARRWMPRLPFDRLDVLLIDRIGKNISGTGMDTNVVGRKYDDHKAVQGEWPRVKVIALRGLTPETHGNAMGMGCAELCKTQLLRDADIPATRLNGITSNQPSYAMAPLDYDTDAEMLGVALRLIGPTQPSEARLAWITNTLALAELECACSLLPEIRARADLEVLGPPRPLPFDAHGNLPDRANW